MQLPNNIPVPNNRTQQNYMRPSLPLPRIGSVEPPLTLPGFYITSEAEIREGDVPMDGSISFFPYKDLTHIAIRQWDGRGNLDGATYVLQPQQPVNQQQNIPIPAPIAQQPAPQPQAQPQQQEPNKDPLLEVLTGMYNGMTNTFKSFETSMQAMQKSLERIEQGGGVG